ncbi:MAG: peptide transporter [Gammaproteobacteria bacterium SG8_31]|jgi:putative OPT family oligopeptide transporter|nr:MAG: peptide transporter [Gammaproteobacteria bacterium SG8_31]
MSHPNELPQLTAKAIVLGVILSMVLAGANAYLGLFAGMTVSASIPAAVISMGILRMFRESNILENNIVQTAASAGESLAAGVIFTIPALVILGYWNVFDYGWVTVIAGLGGLLGVLFTIPLRRSLIIEEGLAYPEGRATAEVLKVGEDPQSGVRQLALAAITGALVKLGSSGLRLWSETAQAATFAGNSIAYIGTNVSPALVSVGYIVGLNIATLVCIGGAISWFVAIPIYSALYLQSDPVLSQMVADGAGATDVAFQIWTSQIRYLGVGAMLTGGIWALVSMRGSLLSGIRSGLHQMSRKNSGPVDHTEQDIPMQVVLVGIALFVVPIFFLYNSIHESIGLGVSLPMTVIMVVAGFLFSSVAAYMAGLVGSSNNPISGITIATILFSSLLLLWLMGPGGGQGGVGPSAAILIGAVVCCAAAIAGDNMQDLKAGHLLGATPWKQQLMQGIGVVSAVLVMAPILNLLLQAYGIGIPTEERPNALLAPQATLMASVAQGVFGAGLPWGMVGLGAIVGGLIIAVDEHLKRIGARWHAPVLAVAVGIYLPLELSVPIFLGGLIAHLVERSLAGGSQADRDRSMRLGVLTAAGLITGEALLGIFLAVPIVISGQPDVLAISDEPLGGAPGLVIVAGIAIWMYRTARHRDRMV